jgi:hypothetical protein
MSLSGNVYTSFEIDLLEKWCKCAKSFYLLHDKSHNEYVIKNYGLTIPVIILSTLSGTASFSIQSFPESLRSYIPMIIGGVNIFVGILQTMTQFMKINELVSEHRTAAINFDKFARNITAELALPENERTYSGKDFVHICRKEMDRIIEQSPIIPQHILSNLDNLIKNDTISNNQNKVIGYLDSYNIQDNVTFNISDVKENFSRKINKIKDNVIKEVIDNTQNIRVVKDNNIGIEMIDMNSV